MEVEVTMYCAHFVVEIAVFLIDFSSSSYSDVIFELLRRDGWIMALMTTGRGR